MASKNTKVTIQEIAHRANVSPSTVSRVLQGTTAVSKIKHQAVMDAVRELDYRPNIFAQKLDARFELSAMFQTSSSCFLKRL